MIFYYKVLINLLKIYTIGVHILYLFVSNKSVFFWQLWKCLLWSMTLLGTQYADCIGYQYSYKKNTETTEDSEGPLMWYCVVLFLFNII
jgi:hypothetical protein